MRCHRRDDASVFSPDKKRLRRRERKERKKKGAKEEVWRHEKVGHRERKTKRSSCREEEKELQIQG